MAGGACKFRQRPQRKDQRLSKITHFQTVFVSRNGEKEFGPIVEISNKPMPQFNEQDWSKPRCLREFSTFLQSRDSSGLEAAMTALDRLGCWREAFESLRGDQELGSGLVSFWISYGFHIRQNPALVDAFKRLLPPYSGPGLTLYRGELLSRYKTGAYEIAWSSMRTTAQTFANRREHTGEGAGVVLRTVASSEMIVAHVKGHLMSEEDEYIVDPLMLAEVLVDDR